LNGADMKKFLSGGKKFYLLLALAFVGWAIADPAWFMPSPVSIYHAPIEAQCGRCHRPFRGAPNQSCLKCKVKMKLVTDRGIHRYAPEKKCAACHVEHRTRAYPLASAWVVPGNFNHQWTGYKLDRFHKKLACVKCHPPGRPYRLALHKTACLNCHKDFHPVLWDHRKTGCRRDSLHAGLKCGQCHVKGWGKDKHPVCKSCHPGKKYKPRRVCRETTGKK